MLLKYWYIGYIAIKCRLCVYYTKFVFNRGNGMIALTRVQEPYRDELEVSIYN